MRTATRRSFRRCARDLSVPLVHAAWNTRARMRRRGLSGEAGLRYAAARVPARCRAKARRACDRDRLTRRTTSSRTMLLRLVRGAGLRGLSGISPRRGRWLRPLLEVTRDEIESDLRAAGQSWRDDSSQPIARPYPESRPPCRRARAAPGNRLRRFAERRGSLARRASEGARELQSAARALGDEARRLRTRFARIQDGEIALDSKEVRSYPYALRRLLLRDSWRALKTPSEGLTHRHLTALDRLLRSHRGGAQVALPHGLSRRAGARTS
jgi:tRNA(Ile)-lysidine synthase